MTNLGENLPSELTTFEHAKQVEQFTPEHVGSLFFDSFRFSQGSAEAQEQIFKFLKDRYGDQLSAELIHDGVAIVAPRISSFVGGGNKHKKVDSQYIDSAITQERDEWVTVLQDEHEDQFDAHKMLTHVLLREARFTSGSGRPGRRGEVATSSRSYSRRLSHVIHFGLMGKDTGAPEYNAMFGELIDALKDMPDTLTSPSKAEEDPSAPLSRVFINHFSSYPDDVREITPSGLDILRERFDAPTLAQMGISDIAEQVA